MLEGKHLYEEFKREVQALKGVRRAWFTTFNLDVHFFERYLLPILTGVDDRKVWGIRDYEEMNAILSPKEDTEEEPLDVRLFYDFNAMVRQEEPKRTCINLHPVDTRNFSIPGDRNFFSEGVFHPKVALIQAQDGEVLLMVSSANLTFGGWSRNRECFFIQRLKGLDNARELGYFFSQIGERITDFINDQCLNHLLTGKRWGDNENWKFLSSFSDNNLWEEIKVKEEKTPLTIWSPYWAEDLSAYVTQLLELGFSPIRLLPGKEAGKIGILQEEFTKTQKMDSISFEQENWKDNDVPFIHGKVWMTPSKLAIGSWNATRAGIHLPLDLDKKRGGRRNNVEAGVLINIDREYREIIRASSFKPLGDVLHPSEEELQTEKEKELENFSFPVEVVADWNEACYFLQTKKFSIEDQQKINDLFIILPGKVRKPLSQLEGGIPFYGKQKNLLLDRMFIVEDKQKKTLFRGYVIEIGLESRPLYKFENEIDLLLGWLNGKPEDRTDIHEFDIPRGENADQETDTLSEIERLIPTEQPWFISLQAFVRIRTRIEEIQALGTKNERRKELRKIGRSIPGSLSELRDHMQKRRETYEALKQEDRSSPVYLWFLITETNKCIKAFNRVIRTQGELEAEIIHPLSDLDFIKFIEGKNQAGISTKQVKAYLSDIKTIIRSGR